MSLSVKKVPTSETRRLWIVNEVLEKMAERNHLSNQVSFIYVSKRGEFCEWKSNTISLPISNKIKILLHLFLKKEMNCFECLTVETTMVFLDMFVFLIFVTTSITSARYQMRVYFIEVVHIGLVKICHLPCSVITKSIVKEGGGDEKCTACSGRLCYAVICLPVYVFTCSECLGLSEDFTLQDICTEGNEHWLLFAV